MRILNASVCAALCCALAWATPGSSQKGYKVGAAQKVVEGWDEILRSADDALTANDPKKARKRIDRIWRDCLNWGLSGEAVDRRLAMAFVLQGVAYRRLGDEREARWRWNSALSIYPEVEAWDLTAYGDSEDVMRAGAVEHVSSLPDVSSREEAARLAKQRVFVPGVTLPKAKHRPLPRFARPKVVTQEGFLHTRFVILENGLLALP